MTQDLVTCRSPLVWMHADSSSKRMDEKHLISHRIQLPLPQLAHMLSQVGPPAHTAVCMLLMLCCYASTAQIAYMLCAAQAYLGVDVSFVEQNAVL